MDESARNEREGKRTLCLTLCVCVCVCVCKCVFISLYRIAVETFISSVPLCTTCPLVYPPSVSISLSVAWVSLSNELFGVIFGSTDGLTD